MTEENKPVEEQKAVETTPAPETPAPEVVAEAPKKPEITPEQKAQMAKQKEFFSKIRLGGYFLQFVHEDLQRQKNAQLNRHQRRRLEKELRKGEISHELVNAYVAKVDMIMEYFEEKLNPQRPSVVKEGEGVCTDGTKIKIVNGIAYKAEELAQEIDGAEFYANAKKAEAEGKLNEDGSTKETPDANINPMAQ